MVLVASDLLFKRSFLRCETVSEVLKPLLQNGLLQTILAFMEWAQGLGIQGECCAPMRRSGESCSHSPSICSVLGEVLFWALPKLHRDFSRALAKTSPLEKAHGEKEERNLQTTPHPTLSFLPAEWTQSWHIISESHAPCSGVPLCSALAVHPNRKSEGEQRAPRSGIHWFQKQTKQENKKQDKDRDRTTESSPGHPLFFRSDFLQAVLRCWEYMVGGGWFLISNTNKVLKSFEQLKEQNTPLRLFLHFL